MPRALIIALPALVFLLSACDGGGDPVDQALRDASAENHASTVKEGAVSAPAHSNGIHSAAPGSQAFAASEAEMHARMGTASGDTLDEAYIAKMIEHHRGAVAMADVALAQSRDPEIRRMAEAVKGAQTREIAEMRAWRPSTALTP